MRVRIFDCWMHEHDIRDASGDPPTPTSTGRTSRLALDEIAASMGFVVGKLGGAPDGSRVRARADRPAAAHHQRAVEGRARVVDDFGGPIRRRRSRSTVCCSPGWRAAGRRRPTMTRSPTAATRRSGRRIVEHLNYVI